MYQQVNIVYFGYRGFARKATSNPPTVGTGSDLLLPFDASLVNVPILVSLTVAVRNILALQIIATNLLGSLVPLE